MTRRAGAPTTTTQEQPAEAAALEGELRSLARVLKPALCLLIQFWAFTPDRYPPQHPYRQAATMILRYIERTYGV